MTRLSEIANRITLTGKWGEIRRRLLELHGIEMEPRPTAIVIPFPRKVAS